MEAALGRTMIRLRDVLLALWELPQNVLGGAVLVLARATGKVRGTERAKDRLFVEVSGFAVSLGWFVFWSGETTTRWFHIDSAVRDHEYGHTFQSRWLGPLYLPVVGVPSVMRNLYAVAYREVAGVRWRGYFDGFPERWADQLGGVDRDRAKRAWPSG